MIPLLGNIVLFRRFVKLFHKTSTIVVTVVPTVEWAKSHISSIIISRIDYSSMLFIFQPAQPWNKNIAKQGNFSNNDDGKNYFTS